MFSYKDFISAMKPGIFMDVEIRNRSGLSDLPQNRPKIMAAGVRMGSFLRGKRCCNNGFFRIVKRFQNVINRHKFLLKR